MPNNYFQFKQFTVQQDNCSMKVCTDACIFGASVAHCRLPIANCLDIGTGTGLLSLMLAQNINAEIDAVEIDKAAFTQAKENFETSPWSSRLHIFNTDILNYTADKKYDCIISNPPFFEDDLRSDDGSKNSAKHDTSLTLTQLLSAVNDLLSEEGSFFVLLPFHRIDFFERESPAYHFHLNNKVLIRHTAAHPYFRGILVFSKTKLPVTITELVIKDENGVYTHVFVELLHDYYLNL